MPGQMWNDTDGNPIRAHQPNIVLLEGVYHWYGAAQVGNSSGIKGHINLYTSRDLYNWDFKGSVYASPQGYAARVSMLGWNPITEKYVLWMKGANTAAGNVSFQVAEADHPDGAFHQVATLNAPFGAQAGGSQAFKNPVDNNAYIFYSQKEPREIRVAQLTPDWRGINQKVLAVVGEKFEAPSPFYSIYTKKFYVVCSHLSGWWPNPAELFVADDPAGPWRSLGNPTGDWHSHFTQVAHILPVSLQNNVQKLIYIGDRWEPYINTEEGGRYVFLPMEINGMPFQSVNPNSHVVSRGPVLPGQKDGSILIRDVGGWKTNPWPTLNDGKTLAAGEAGSKGLPAVAIAEAVLGVDDQL